MAQSKKQNGNLIKKKVLSKNSVSFKKDKTIKNQIFTNSKKVLEVKDLSVQYSIGNGMHFNALRNISFDVRKGEVVGLVGESGSGKSTTAKTILGLANHSTGFVKINNELVPNRPKDVKGRTNSWLASKVQMIFQDSKSSLNPREKIYNVIIEGAKNQRLYQKSKKNINTKFITNFLKNNEKYKHTKTYKFFSSKTKKFTEQKKAFEKYDEAYSKIFTKYDDQRVIVRGILLKRKTDINTFKTSYKNFVKSGYNGKNAQLSFDKNHVVNFSENRGTKTKFLNKLLNKRTKLAIDFVLKEKLVNDISKINKECKKNKFREKKLLDQHKRSYIKEKIILKKDLRDEIKKINLHHENEIRIFKKLDDTSESKNLFKKYKKYKKDHKGEFGKKTFYKELAKEVMEKVSISSDYLNRYPGEFSGGQAQRIAIARTLVMKSDLIIADEPISALDVSIQAQVINLLKKIIKNEKLTVLFIAHDLQVVRYISNRIIVMYKGEIIEKGESQEVYKNPIHPYTKSLIKAVPSIDNPSIIKKSRQYVPEHLEDFTNLHEIQKKWFKINSKHEVFGTLAQVRKWKKI